MFRTRITILLICCCLITPAGAAQPSDYLIPGRTQMFQRSLSGLRQAYEIFDSGINNPSCASCANNRELVFLHAVTRTAMLFIDNNNTLVEHSFFELAEEFGLSVVGDYFEFLDVQVELNKQGGYTIPADAPDADQITAVMQNSIVPEIDAIIAELDSISDSPGDRFRIFFTPSETGLEEDLEVDYGEVLVLKGLLLAFKGQLEAQSAYDLYISIDGKLKKAADNLFNGKEPGVNFNINKDFLQRYPNLLKVLPTLGHSEDGAAMLAQSAQDVIAAIDYYFAALNYITSEDDPPGTDPQEDELIYVDSDSLFLLEVINERLTVLRDSLANDTPMNLPVHTSRTYDIYDSQSNLIGQLVLVSNLSDIEGGSGSLTLNNITPSTWEVDWFDIGEELEIDLENHTGGKWYEGYFWAALSSDRNTIQNGTFDYWGWSYGDLAGLSGELTGTVLNELAIDLNPVFGNSTRYPSPVNPRDLLPEFDNNNNPLPGKFGRGLGYDATLGGILPGMTQQTWSSWLGLPPPPEIDLIGEEIRPAFKFPAKAGDKGKVSVVIKNQGNDTAKGRININIYASTDENLDALDLLLGGKTNQAVNLQSGKSMSITINNILLSKDMPSGDYYILAAIVPIDFSESQIANNLTASAETISIAQPNEDIEQPYVDLVAEEISPVFKAPVNAGDKGKVTLVVKNQGNDTAKGKININIYLSADDTIDGGDTLLAGKIGQSINLKKDKTKKLNFKVVLPGDLPAGDYYFLADIASSDILESNVSNNIALTSYTIE